MLDGERIVDDDGYVVVKKVGTCIVEFEADDVLLMFAAPASPWEMM